MGVSPGFFDFLKDQLADFGPVSVRGGTGLCCRGLMFALVDYEIMQNSAPDRRAIATISSNISGRAS